MQYLIPDVTLVLSLKRAEKGHDALTVVVALCQSSLMPVLQELLELLESLERGTEVWFLVKGLW